MKINILDFEVNLIALVVLLDNVNLKNSANFRRLHLLFSQSMYNIEDYIESMSSKVLLIIKELYENNCSNYDEEVKREYKWIIK